MAADEAKTAPVFRAVEALSGQVARPTSLLASYAVIDGLQTDVDALVEKVQGVQAETELVRGMLLKATAALDSTTVELVHALNARDESDTERDDAERECGELRDQLEAARCRLQELEPRQRADDV